MPYRPSDDPPVKFVDGETIDKDSLNEALDNARQVVELPTAEGTYRLELTVDAEGEPSFDWVISG